MSTIVRYSSGSTYTLAKQRVDTDMEQDAGLTSALIAGMNLGVPLSLQRITVTGQIASKTACSWYDIVAISLDSGTSYQTVYSTAISFDQDGWSSIYGYILTLKASPLKMGTAVLFPPTGTQWGLSTASGVHQHGVIESKAGIVYEGPDCYFSLLQTLAGIGNLAIGFTRAAGKTVNGVAYLANTPIFGIAGLLVSETTSQDVPTILVPVATVRTVAARLTVYGSPTGTVTVWTATHNKLTINLTASTMSLTDDTTTVSCTFPSSAYLAGTAVTVVAIEGASHAVTIACQAAAGSWYTASGTLAALLWTNTLIIGNLKGWIAHLTQWPYVLTSGEYQAIHWPMGPLTWNGLTIGHKNTGTLTLDESGVLLDAAGNDISGLVAGNLTLPANGTTVDVTQTEGLSSRWYATARDTSI